MQLIIIVIAESGIHQFLKRSHIYHSEINHHEDAQNQGDDGTHQARGPHTVFVLLIPVNRTDDAHDTQDDARDSAAAAKADTQNAAYQSGYLESVGRSGHAVSYRRLIRGIHAIFVSRVLVVPSILIVPLILVVPRVLAVPVKLAVSIILVVPHVLIIAVSCIHLYLPRK